MLFTRLDIDREHVELFPNKRFLPKDVVENLNEMVMHALAGGQKPTIAFGIIGMTRARKHYLWLMPSAF